MKTHSQMLIQTNGWKIRFARSLSLASAAHNENQTDRIRVLTPSPWRISSINFRSTRLHNPKYTATNTTTVQEMTISRTGMETGWLAFLFAINSRMSIFKLIRHTQPINIAVRVPKFENR